MLREEQLRETAVKKRKMLDSETTGTLTAQAREIRMHGSHGSYFAVT